MPGSSGTGPGLFAIGIKPEFDATKAEVDLFRARLILSEAENACRLAQVSLNLIIQRV